MSGHIPLYFLVKQPSCIRVITLRGNCLTLLLRVLNSYESNWNNALAYMKKRPVKNELEPEFACSGKIDACLIFERPPFRFFILFR